MAYEPPFRHRKEIDGSRRLADDWRRLAELARKHDASPSDQGTFGGEGFGTFTGLDSSQLTSDPNGQPNLADGAIVNLANPGRAGAFVQGTATANPVTITGVVPPTDVYYQAFALENTGPATITLASQSTKAPAGGALKTSSGSDLTLLPYQLAYFLYDPVLQQWLVTVLGAAAGGGGTVTTLTAGDGIILTPNPITGTGTVAVDVPLDVDDGGTLRTILTAHAVLLGEGTSAVNFAPPVATGYLLTDNGPGVDPTFQPPPAAGITSIAAGDGILLSPNPITGTGTVAVDVPLDVDDGGTGDITLTSHAVLLGEGTSPVAFAPPVSSGYVLTDNGTGADPTFQPLSTALGTGNSGGNAEQWYVFEIDYTDAIFKQASQNVTKTLSGVLPARANIDYCYAEITSAWTGTPSGITFNSGPSANNQGFIKLYMLSGQVPSNTSDQKYNGVILVPYLVGLTLADDLLLNFTCSGVNFGTGSATNLTGGHLKMHLLWGLLR